MRELFNFEKCYLMTMSSQRKWSLLQSMRRMVNEVLVLIVSVATLTLIGSCDSTPQEDAPIEEVASDNGSESLGEAIARNPNDPELYYARARNSYDTGNYGDAAYDLAKAMSIDSVNEAYHHLLADVYISTYDSESALRTMERALRLFPESTASNLKMSELLIILKQFQPAATTLQGVLEREPQNIEALQLLGVLFKEQGDIEQAIMSFRRVVELDGDNYEGWTMLGNLLDIEGDASALQCFENAIAIDSTYPQGWHSKAFYLQNHGDIPQAIEIYEKIQTFDPTYADAYLNAGILYLEFGDTDNAAIQFTNLIEQYPTDPTGVYYMGVVSEEAEDYEDALKYYNQASSLSPRSIRFAESAERMRIVLNK